MNKSEFREHALPVLCELFGWISKSQEQQEGWFRILKKAELTKEQAPEEIRECWLSRHWLSYHPTPQEFLAWHKKNISRESYVREQVQRSSMQNKFGLAGLLVRMERQKDGKAQVRFGWIGDHGYKVYFWMPIHEEHKEFLGNKKWLVAGISMKDSSEWEVFTYSENAPEKWIDKVEEDGWPFGLRDLYEDERQKRIAK